MILSTVVLFVIAIIFLTLKKKQPSQHQEDILRSIPLHQHLCSECGTIWSHRIGDQKDHMCPTCQTFQYARYYSEADSLSLRDFLLEQFIGYAPPLKTLDDTSPELTDPSAIDNHFSDGVCFYMRQEHPPLDALVPILIKYYEQIGWQISLETSQNNILIGTVYPYDGLALGLTCFYGAYDEEKNLKPLCISTEVFIP